MKVENERETFGKCPDPQCGGEILEGEKSFYCSNSKKAADGGKDCKVHIAKHVMGVVFDKQKVRELFAKKETPYFEGVDKLGRKQTFKMSYSEETKEIAPEFKNSEEPQKPLGKCPKCGKDVFIGPKAYFCVGRKDNTCDFIMYRQTAGANFTPEMVSDLLTGKTLDNVVCFTKEGEEYQAGFRLDKEKDTLMKINYGGKKKKEEKESADVEE